MQEIYDKKTLHTLLGRKPQPSVVNGAGSKNDPKGNGNLPSSSSGAKSVQSAWKEADPGSDHDDGHHSRRRSRHTNGEDEEEGRYDISRQQPPLKRRKIGKVQDAHTVFTTDDEEDELIGDDTAGEEEHYTSDGALEKLASRDPEKVDKRRSYWLSKGIGLGSRAGDDSS